MVALSSCTESGCIEADEYGEYENQLLSVYPNTQTSNCRFDSTQKINNTSYQGAGMLSCLSSINFTASTSPPDFKGCERITLYNDRRSCFESCSEQCLQDIMKNSANAEPSWVATTSVSSNSTPTITIYPDTEIMIKAVGNVKLGDEVYSNYIATDARSYKYDTINLENLASNQVFNKYFLDLIANSSTTIKFYGTWTDSGDASPDVTTNRTIGPGTSSLTQPSVGILEDTTGNQIINGIKRILAYIIPHPDEYYLDPACKGEIRNGSTNKESTCTKGTPLLPDPRVWTCSYPTGSPALSATCENNSSNGSDYKNFYPNSIHNSQKINSIFPVSNSSRSSILGTYGGFIRWNDDMLRNNSFDPFLNNSVSCDSNANCSNVEKLDYQYEGRMIGNISSGNLLIVNNASFAKRIYFKSLGGGTACVSGYNLSITNLDPRSPNYNKSQVIPITASWSSSFIDIESSGRIEIERNSTASSSGINCGGFTAMKYLPYHDIKILRSGFVKFSIMRASGSCNIRARIVNSGATDSEYYEFQNASDDPFYNLNVLSSPSSSIMSWSNEVFVRKNQIIRFAPDSWDNNFITPNGTAQCGIGMAMYITPRPAVICKGIGYDLVDNTRCIPDTDSNGIIIGCKPYSSQCEDASSSSYCPTSSNCQYKMLSCLNGTQTSAKTGCIASTTETVGDCKYTSSITSSKCSSCSTFLVSSTKEIPKYKITNVDSCFDVENYNGRISSIALDTNGEISSTLSDKGLKFLQSFNGTYGSFYPAIETKETQSSNKVYQTRNPIIPNVNGRLILSYIDGSNFNVTNTSSSNNSGGLNFKTGISLAFKNGEWLEVILCSDSGTNCYGSNPNLIPLQLPVVANSTPTDDVSRQFPNYSTGNYKFDASGLLYRFTPTDSTKDCRLNGVVTQTNSSFYCHTHESRTANDLNMMTQAQKATRNTNIEKIRLSFKIKDPEQTNCYTSRVSDSGYPYDGSSPPYDGILTDNYDSDGSGSNTEYCDKSSFANNATCRKKFICVNSYSNNTGKYDVMVRVKSTVNNNFSKIIGSIVEPFTKIFDGYTLNNKYYVGETERLYKLIIKDLTFITFTKLAMVLMITFYGISYLMGVSELSQSEIFNRYFKIAFIYLFIGDQGWEWFKEFVINLFKNGTDFLAFSFVSNFDNSPEILAAINSSNYDDKSLLFRSVDKVINIAFSDTVGKKISSFLFSGFFGWAYIIIFYYSILKFVYAVANSLMLYITAKFFISILFICGPIFIVFTLFEKTKPMFDRWLKYIISFSFQQIMITTILSFFSLLMYEIIKLTLNFKICWEEIWVINLGLRFSLISFWTISNVPKSVFVQAGGYSSGISQSVPTLFSILFIFIIANLMKGMITYMDSLASMLGGGLSSSTLSSGLQKAANQIKNTLKSTAKSIGNEALEKTGLTGLKNIPSRLDDYLFDSGRIADQKRKENGEKIKKEEMTRNSMSNAGKDAVNKYKKENALELAKLSKDERQEKLKKVRDEAMIDKGKQLGLKDDQINKMMYGKGEFKTNSENIIVNAAKYLSHLRRSSGGLAGEKINDNISSSAIKKAMRDMSESKSTGIGKMIDTVQSISDKVMNAVDKAKKIANAVRNAPANLKQGVKDLANKAKSAVMNKVNDATKSMKDKYIGALKDLSKKKDDDKGGGKK